MKKLLLLLVAVAFLSTSCAIVKEHKKTAIGTGVGAAVGAGVGYAVGGGTGAAIGAGVGALAGGGIGYMMERQEKEFKRTLADSEAASIEREKRVIEEANTESLRREQEVLVLSFKSDFWFDTNSALLKSGAQSELERVATILNKYPDSQILIEGHTDSTGDETYNLKLSERRATAVQNDLTSKGVDPSRMQVIGLGESKPVADNTTAEGRQTNRRVSIVIVPTSEQS